MKAAHLLRRPRVAAPGVLSCFRCTTEWFISRKNSSSSSSSSSGGGGGGGASGASGNRWTVVNQQKFRQQARLSSVAAAVVSRVECDRADQTVTIEWSDRERSVLHALWLLDNDPSNREKSTTQKIRNVTDLPPELGVDDATVSTRSGATTSLQVRWSDGHTSTYDGPWLRAAAVAGSVADHATATTIPRADVAAATTGTAADAGAWAFLRRETNSPHDPLATALRAEDPLPSVPFDEVTRPDAHGDAAVYQWTKVHAYVASPRLTPDCVPTSLVFLSPSCERREFCTSNMRPSFENRRLQRRGYASSKARLRDQPAT
jgi:hypothetical protein